MNEQNYIISQIKEELEKTLLNAGIYYRIFARQKSTESIKKKLAQKGDDYRKKGKKMQDLIGVRIVFYFMEDVDIINKYLHTLPNYDSDSDSMKDIARVQNLITNEIEDLASKMFMPTRLNLVFRMDEKCTTDLNRELSQVPKEEFDGTLIDNTYELQLRTVLSEGWHEVEHDLRYKSRNEDWWKECDEESRMLNGIYATLETSERALDQIFSSIAYKNYKSHDWSAMLRNHMKIHTMDMFLSQPFIDILNANPDVAKSIYRVSRKKIIEWLMSIGRPFPLKLDNVLCLLNRMSCKDPHIIEMEPLPIKSLLDKKIN